MAALYDLKLESGWSPYGPEWTDSAPGMPPLSCAVMSVLAAHPFDYSSTQVSVSVFTESGLQLCHYTATAVA
jgi:hypothetical protein